MNPCSAVVEEAHFGGRRPRGRLGRGFEGGSQCAFGKDAGAGNDVLELSMGGMAGMAVTVAGADVARRTVAGVFGLKERNVQSRACGSGEDSYASGRRPHSLTPDQCEAQHLSNQHTSQSSAVVTS